ncbi:MAG: HEAT repeat domain-containing protein [Phycisphaerae bacterium]
MSKSAAIAGLLFVGLFLTAIASADSVSDNWNDFLHYTKIGRLDMAKGYGRDLVDSNPDPAVILELSRNNPNAVILLQRAADNEHDKELASLASQVLGFIEQGKFGRRTDSSIIAEEIRRLSTTTRGRLAAVERLRNSGEYAIPFMLDALADPSRREEAPNIIWTLPQIGRDAIRPLAAALQTDNTAVKAEIIKALGGIGYPQSLAYLKFVVEQDNSADLRELAAQSIHKIDPAASVLPAAELFYQLAESYYYRIDSLSPAEDADFANIWFWDAQGRNLTKMQVSREYFYELMAMRACEWALRADPDFGKAIGLWIAAFFKAESVGLSMPEYFGQGHADAMTYAKTAGPEYLHQALARAIKDNNAHIALNVVEALAVNAGEKSLMFRVATEQPLLAALTFDDKAVRYSAAIAIAAAGPQEIFAENRIVIKNLSQALAEDGSKKTDNFTAEQAESYALRAANVLLKLAIERNPVIDIGQAENALINAANDKREQIRLLAIQILAHLRTAEAQQSIASIALTASNPMNIRLAAFDALVTSAKINGSLLNDPTIDSIYSLVGSKQTDPQIRGAAASVFGALNLPSQKVKDLILDQARS